MKTERAGRLIYIIASTIIALMLMTSMVSHAASASSTCSIKIDGTVIATDAAPIVENGTTLVPIAVIVDYLGGISSWDQAAQKATIKNGSTTVVLTIGSKTASINGASKTLLTAPRIVTVNSDGGGRTMVPLRFIAEAFDYDVAWDSATRTALVTTKNTSAENMTVEDTEILSDQTYSGSTKYTLVKITADRSLKSGNYTGTSLSDPYRYYIDFDAASLGSAASSQKSLSADKSYVTSVRTGVNGNSVRVVCDLKANVKPEISYSDDGKTMILAFPETNTTTVDPDPVDKPGSGEQHGTITQTVQGTTKDDVVEHYDPYADGKLVVCIDPGHGQTTGGKRSPDGSLREYEFNRDVAYRLKALLEAQGVTCIMTVSQSDTTDPSLASRVAIADSAGNVDLFVSIHANAFGDGWNTANGWEVYSYQTGGVSEMAAKAVESATMNSSAGLKDRGCKTANFYVIKNTEMPAILIEHGFYTNEAECEKLKSSSFRDILAQADATGIMNFFKQFNTQ